MIFKFLKFGIVGFSGLIIDFSITFLLKEKLRLNRYIASSTGFIFAATSNWILNRLWTFKSSYSQVFIEYGTFLAVSLIGLGINNLFIYLFETKVRFYWAKLGAIMVTTVWNFLVNYFITFNL